MLFLSIFGIGELYEFTTNLVKTNTRKLTEREFNLAKTVYGNSLKYDRIRIDNKARIGAKTNHIYYVSFYTINAWGSMSDDIFIHELMHIWQYQKMGIRYIPKALFAQHTSMGYNYGGLPALQKHNTFKDFNLEQQADIVSDYFRIKMGFRPRWGSATREDLWVYEKYIEALNA